MELSSGQLAEMIAKDAVREAKGDLDREAEERERQIQFLLKR